MSKSSAFRMTAGVWARIGILAAFSAVVVACGGSSDNSNGGGGKKTATATPTATTTTSPTPTATPTVTLTICPQDFALCAASTCTETGKTITQNDGQTFPAVTCTCPIIHGPGIADVNAGNMKGSCDSPEGGVWSIYWPKENIPQAAATPAWSEAPAPFFVCTDGKFSQCWNFACTEIEPVNGQRLAQCTCPEESTTGNFATQAGFLGEAGCSELPVAGAIPGHAGGTPTAVASPAS